MWKDSHYAWLEKHLVPFLSAVGLDRPDYYTGLISAHGDKCYCYRARWEAEGIPFAEGVAIFLLTYIPPWSKRVRMTDHGWVAPEDWVITYYPKFKPALEQAKKDTAKQEG